MIIEKISPKPLNDSEQLIIDEITADGTVFFKPRKIKVTRFEGVPDSWQGIFNNAEDYAGWITFNRLQRLDADLMDGLFFRGSGSCITLTIRSSDEQ